MSERDPAAHEETLCSMCEGIDPHQCPQCKGDPMSYWYREDCQCQRCCNTRRRASLERLAEEVQRDHQGRLTIRRRRSQRR